MLPRRPSYQFLKMLPRSSLSWHPSGGLKKNETAAETVLDSLGTDELREVTIDSLKWRFFEMGIRVGIALQMLLMCLLLILSSNEAVDELAKLYYPLFRGVFLLSFFGVLFALMLFAWKRTGIDYGSIFGVSHQLSRRRARCLHTHVAQLRRIRRLLAHADRAPHDQHARRLAPRRTPRHCRLALLAL